jgi:hypothetical protein
MPIVNGKGKLTISLVDMQRILDDAKKLAEHNSMQSNLVFERKGDKITVTQHCVYPECKSIHHIQ